MSQLPLSLILPDSAAIKDFFVTQANDLAYGWVQKWPDWPAPYYSINIWGPKGCGKTHLSDIFATKLHCQKLDRLTHFNREDFHAFDGFILDNVTADEAPHLWDDEALFHLMNYLAETGKSVLITSQQPVSQMTWRLPDAASRLRAIPAQEVSLPDDELLAALLDQYFLNRQCQVTEPAMRYILARVERSYEAVAEIAQAIDKASLAEKKPVTMALVRSLFQEMAEKGEK